MGTTQYERRQRNNNNGRYYPVNNPPPFDNELAVLRREMTRSRSAQQSAAVTLGRIEDRLTELVRDMDTKVDKNVYDGQLGRITDRIIRLESGPQRFLQWVSIGIAACSLLMVILAAVGGAIIYVVGHP